MFADSFLLTVLQSIPICQSPNHTFYIPHTFLLINLSLQSFIHIQGPFVIRFCSKLQCIHHGVEIIQSVSIPGNRRAGLAVRYVGLREIRCHTQCHKIRHSLFSTESFFLLTSFYIYKEDRNIIPLRDGGKQAGQVYNSRRWQT